MNQLNFPSGRSLLKTKNPQSILKVNEEIKKNEKNLSYVIGNQGGIFKKTQNNLMDSEILESSAEIRVIDSETNIYKSNGAEKQELIRKLGAQFEKSNISIPPEKLSELVNQIQKVNPQTSNAENCIKVENNIFVISSCQMLNNKNTSIGTVCNEASVMLSTQREDNSIKSKPIPEVPSEIVQINENTPNLAEYFQNFSVPPDFIQNLNETQLNYVTKAVKNAPSDGNFSFWM
jgi:hypothetical protein